MTFYGLPITLSFCIVLAACSGGQPADSPGDRSDTPAAELTALSEPFAGIPAEALLADPTASEIGRQLFLAHCADCHGADAEPTRGVPSLGPGQFSYGADPEAIRRTITAGRHSVMPALGRQLGEVDIGQLVAYVQTLAADGPGNEFEQRGAGHYATHCANCHGDDGSGNQALGAPDLRDDIWQHGDSMMNIRLVITRGVESTCPDWGETLTDTEIELLVAYTLRRARDGAASY